MTICFWVSYMALWVGFIVLLLGSLELLRQVGLIRQSVPLPKPLVMTAISGGDQLPSVRVPSAAGGDVVDWTTRLSRGVGVLLFVSPRCPYCYALMQDLPEYLGRLGEKAYVLPVLKASAVEADAFLASVGVPPTSVALDSDGTVADRLGITFSPGAVVVTNGTVREAAVTNQIGQLDSLIEKAFGQSSIDETPLGRRPLSIADASTADMR